MIVTAFDPIKGRGPELTRFATDPTMELQDLTLSPDGTRIAVIRGPEGPIQIFSLRGQAPQEISQNGWKSPRTVNWSADGRGLFVYDATSGGATLLYFDLRGKAQALWKVLGGSYNVGRPSPDGQHLAYVHSIWDSNMWMMENF